MNLWAAAMLVAGGIFAGGAATFAWSRVPIWRRMAASGFVTDFEQTIARTDKVQPALLVVTIVSAIGFALTADGLARALALVGAAAFVLTLVASVAIMVPLQRRIIASSQQPPDAIEAMRHRWFTGHRGRATLAAACFTLAAIAAVV